MTLVSHNVRSVRFMISHLFLGLAGLGLLACPARAERSREMQRAIQNGLDYLARTQSRSGTWLANGGAYPISMTSMAGLALAFEGSTPNEGRYSKNIAAAVDHLVAQAQPATGLIGNPRNNDRYMYGHGFALLFLSQIYGEEEDPERRARLKQVLTKAVEFCGRAQTTDGGWGYVSAKDGGGFDEGSVTVTQMQGLRGAKNAGILVPKGIIDGAISYIEKSVLPSGGLRYSLKSGGGGERPPITAAGIAVLYSAGQYDSQLVPKMFAYCEKAIPLSLSGSRQFGHEDYSHLYYSQACYFQGEAVWRKYIASVGPELVKMQHADGHWTHGYVGDVFSTACSLMILQLESNTLPVYQR